MSRQFDSGARRYQMTISPLVGSSQELIGLVVMITLLESSIETSLHNTLRRFGRIGTRQLQLPENTVTWSDETYAIHGRPPESEALPLDRAIGSIHPDDHSSVRGHLEKAMQEGGSFHFTARITRADGRTAVIESAGTVVTDRLNTPFAVVGVVRDFSRMQTESTLLRHYYEITTSEGIGVYSCDIINGVNYWTPKLYSLLGLDPSEPPSIEAARERLSPESAKRARGLLEAVQTYGDPYEFEGALRQPDGNYARYRSSGQAHRTEDGRISHVFGSLRMID